MEDLTQFKIKISNASLEELKVEKQKLEDSLAQMVFDGTLILKITLLNEAIYKKEKN